MDLEPLNESLAFQSPQAGKKQIMNNELLFKLLLRTPICFTDLIN